MKHIASLILMVIGAVVIRPCHLPAQSKPLKELRVPYALGGSTGFFWIAHKSGAFEKYGLKVLPIFMRGGREAVQALISRDVSVMQQGSSGVITAWAQGAKDLVAIGATGNKLDYIFVSTPAIKKPADLKGKRIAISQLGASTDFIARIALRQLGLSDKERDAGQSRRSRRALGRARRRPCRCLVVSTAGHAARSQIGHADLDRFCQNRL